MRVRFTSVLRAYTHIHFASMVCPSDNSYLNVTADMRSKIIESLVD